MTAVYALVLLAGAIVAFCRPAIAAAFGMSGLSPRGPVLAVVFLGLGTAMLPPLPNVFAAAYFSACVIIVGAIVCSLAVVILYLRSGGE